MCVFVLCSFCDFLLAEGCHFCVCVCKRSDLHSFFSRVEGYIQRAWQEFFGALRILTSIAIFLVVEALNYVTNHVARPLFLGVVIMTGNRLVKPVLAGLFNLILQPFVIFSWNFVSGVRHVCQPLIDILGGVTSKLAVLLQAFRLVEVNLGDEYLQSRRGVSAGRGARQDGEVV